MVIRHRLVVAAVVLATALGSCAIAPVEEAGGRADSGVPASRTPVPMTPSAEAPSQLPSLTPTPSTMAPGDAAPSTTLPGTPASSTTTPGTTSPSDTTPTVTSKRPASAPSSTRSTALPDATLPAVPAGPVDCAVSRCVALTFDDGPNSGSTLQVVAALTRAQAPATFFMLSSMAQANPGVVSRIAANPRFEIGSHTVSHPKLTTLSAASVGSQVNTSASVLRSLSGRRITLFRPPYGSHNATVDAACRVAGQAVIIWDVDTQDWLNRNTATTTANAVNAARNGSIVLMHDIHPSTAAAVPGIISQLRAKGFVLVTVSELLGGPTPGKTYLRRG